MCWGCPTCWAGAPRLVLLILQRPGVNRAGAVQKSFWSSAPGLLTVQRAAAMRAQVLSNLLDWGQRARGCFPKKGCMGAVGGYCP